MGSASYAAVCWIRCWLAGSLGRKQRQACTGIGGGAKIGTPFRSIAFRGVGEVLARVKSFIVKAMEGGMKERKEFEKMLAFDLVL